MTDLGVDDDPELDALMDAMPLSPPNSIDSVVLEALISSVGTTSPTFQHHLQEEFSASTARPIPLSNSSKIDFSECTTPLFILQPAGEQLKAVPVTPRKPDPTTLSEIIKLQAMSTDRVPRSKANAPRELFPPARKSEPAPTPGMPSKHPKKE